jgi:hypothetical protein
MDALAFAERIDSNVNKNCLFYPNLTFSIWKHAEYASVKPLYKNVNAIKAKFWGIETKCRRKLTASLTRLKGCC